MWVKLSAADVVRDGFWPREEKELTEVSKRWYPVDIVDKSDSRYQVERGGERKRLGIGLCISTSMCNYH